MTSHQMQWPIRKEKLKRSKIREKNDENIECSAVNMEKCSESFAQEQVRIRSNEEMAV